MHLQIQHYIRQLEHSGCCATEVLDSGRPRRMASRPCNVHQRRACAPDGRQLVPARIRQVSLCCIDITIILTLRFSLSSTFFRNRIVGALRTSEESAVQQAVTKISSNFVFEYPTIEQLATALERLIDPSSSAAQEAAHASAIRVGCRRRSGKASSPSSS